MGDLLTQKLPVPKNVQQVISHHKLEQAKSSSLDEKSEINQAGDKSPTDKSSAPRTQPSLNSAFLEAPVPQLSRDELHKIQNTWDIPSNFKTSKDTHLEESSADQRGAATV